MSNRLVSIGQSSLIPIKATGKLEDEFFDKPQYEPTSMTLLKKKEDIKNQKKKDIQLRINGLKMFLMIYLFMRFLIHLMKTIERSFILKIQNLKQLTIIILKILIIMNNFWLIKRILSRQNKQLGNRRKQIEKKIQNSKDQINNLKNRKNQKQSWKRDRDKMKLLKMQKGKNFQSTTYFFAFKKLTKKAIQHLPFKNYSLAIVGPKSSQQMFYGIINITNDNEVNYYQQEYFKDKNLILISRLV